MATRVYMNVVNRPTQDTLSQAVADMITKLDVLSFAAISPINGLNEAAVWGYSD